MCRFRPSEKHSLLNVYQRQTTHLSATIDYVDVANSWMVQVDANAC